MGKNEKNKMVIIYVLFFSIALARVTAWYPLAHHMGYIIIWFLIEQLYKQLWDEIDVGNKLY